MNLFARLPIRTKLTLVITFLLATLSLIVYIYFPARLESQAVSAVIQNAATLTELTAAELGDGLSRRDPSTVAASLAAIRRQAELVYVVVRDTHGNSFGSFNELVAEQYDYGSIATHPLANELHMPGAPLLQDNTATDLHEVAGGYSSDGRIFQTVAPVRDHGRVVGTLYIGLSLDRVYAATSRSRAAVAFFTVVAFLIAVIATYALSTLITGPLQRIVDTAEEISAGDLSRRADVHANDEVGQLANAFNAMIDRLHGAWKQLEDWGRTLEVRVEERTSELKGEVEERRRAETALRVSEEKYRLLIDRNLAGVYVATEEGYVVACNDACARVFGYPSREAFLAADTAIPFLHLRDRETTLRTLADEGTVANQEVELRRRNGTTAWVLQNIRLVREPDGAGSLEGIILDITDRKRTEEEIEFKAYHDALTGLPNRALFLDRLAVALAHAERNDSKLAVMFLDLDDMKAVNDTLGHDIGDRLLRAIADLLPATLRRGDTVARVGGDEFLILLTDLEDEGDAEHVAAKVLNELRSPIMIDTEEVFVTASIGVALFPSDARRADDLIRRADGAMYDVKQRGGNDYAFCRRIARVGPGRMSIEQQLRYALDRDEFVVYYQPQVILATRELSGVEALVRWDHPTRALIEPAGFIGAAEHAGLIAPVGEIVLRKACEQMIAWLAAGSAPPRVAVNVSARQFYQRNFIGVVERTLSETSLDPRRLELEITETVAMQKTDRTMHMLAALREMGITLAIDDFGTGQSSLTYLKRFPIDTVKIDKSFIRDIDKHGSDEWIVTAVLMLASKLGLRTVAEGVEHEEQCAFLLEHDCSEIQGYLVSRPVPAADLEARFLRRPASAATSS